MNKLLLDETYRRRIIGEATELVSGGMSISKAAETLGVKVPTLARWLKQIRDAGGDVAAAAVIRPTGRRRVFDPTEEETKLARFYRLKKESINVAVHFFILDERVSHETRETLRGIQDKALANRKREEWPDSVRKAFHVTATEKAMARGKKTATGVEMVTRRGMFEVLEDGSEREILPGDTWELDDYSTNQPYVYPDAETRELMLGRQVLAAKDLASAKWLGFDMIGRPLDAYRGEDIARYIERLVTDFGLPKRLRLERGSWESSAVHGIEVEGMTGRWGDLRDIIIIEHVFKSKGKGLLEGGFNFLQRWLSHTGRDIGRTRGEFEEATKDFLKAKSTGANPLELGFISQDKAILAHIAAAEKINSMQMGRSHLPERISPDDLVALKGWHARPLPPEANWYFLPYKAKRTVRSGTVEFSPGKGWEPMRFAVNGIVDGLYLESGHQILIACDPARPELGARICNADLSSRNRDGFRIGQVLIESAPYLALAPQFSATSILSPHLPIAKKARAAAVTSYASVRSASGAPQHGGKREAVAMDGKGNAARGGTVERAEPIIIAGPIPESIRPIRSTREITPATSSRAMPADPQAEIRRLSAALIED